MEQREEKEKKEVQKSWIFFRWGIFLNIMIHDPWRGTFVYGSEVVCKKEREEVCNRNFRSEITYTQDHHSTQFKLTSVVVNTQIKE